MKAVRRLLRCIAAPTVCAMAMLVLIGTVLRLTVRDQYDGLAIVYYATPWPVLGFLSAALGVAFVPRIRGIGIAFLCAAVAFGITWASQSWIRQAQSSEHANCRLFLWNAEHPKRLLPEVIETARRENADILGITETESTEPWDAQRWKEAFPGYSVRTLPGYMLFMTRLTVSSFEDGSLGDAGQYNVIRLLRGGREITVLFVEFDATPWKSRRPAFEAMDALLHENRGRELLVMGDFNTPRESAYFDPIRLQMVHAFEAGGNGMAETWPVPLPVLCVDHVWTTRGLPIARCVLGQSSLSDHRSMTVDFRF